MALSDSRFQRCTDAASIRYKTVTDLVRTLAAVDIPIQKVDSKPMRHFLRNSVINGGAIPKSTQIRKEYLPELYEQEKSSVKSKLMGHMITIQADETTDAQDRPIMNILGASLEALDDNGHLVYFLLDTVILTGKVDHASVAQAIMACISAYGFDFNMIRVFNSDAAAYMQKCYRDVLSAVFPNCVHITCLAHLMNLLGESFRKPFTDVNEFVRKMSAMCFHAGSRKSRLKQYLVEQKAEDASINASLAPNPVQTRWNSWYYCVKHHLPNMAVYPRFIQEELIFCGTKSPASLAELRHIFGDSVRYKTLVASMRFIVERSQTIINHTAYFESSAPRMLDAFDRMEQIQIIFSIPLDHETCAEYFHNLALPVTAKEALIENFTQAFTSTSDKLTR